MQTVSANDRTLVEALEKVSLHLYLEGVAMAADIVSAAYVPACAGGQGFSIGNACAARLDITVEGTGIAFAGKALQVTWDVDGVEYPLFQGTVTPDGVKESENRTTLTAYDAFYTGGVLGYAPSANVLTACTCGDVLSDIAAQMGVSVESGTSVSAQTLALLNGVGNLGENVSCSQAAGYIAMLMGGNAVINRSGELEVKCYTSTDFSVDPYASGAAADADDYTVTGLTFQRRDTVTGADGLETEQSTDFEAGDGSLGFENPLATQSLVNHAFAVLEGVTLRGGTFSIPGGLLLEPGDLFTVDSAFGCCTAGCMSMTMEYDGGFKTTVISLGTPPAEGTPGPLTQAVNAVAADVANVKTVVAENARITNAAINNLEANKASIGDLTAATAEIADLYATKASVTELLVQKADIDLLNVSEANIEDLFVRGNLLAADITGVTVNATRYLTGVTVVGDVIQANTLTAEKLILTGEDGLIYELNAQLGTLTASQLTEEQYRSRIDGSVLVANSVTADRINVTDLFAQDITATGTISGLNIEGGTIRGGTLSSPSGTIGGWTIGGNALYNGPASITDVATAGVYLGTDGIVSNDGLGSYVKIHDGKMSASCPIDGSDDTLWVGIGANKRVGVWVAALDTDGNLTTETCIGPDGILTTGVSNLYGPLRVTGAATLGSTLTVEGTISAPMLIQCGKISITPSASNTPTSGAVTFDTPFPGTPVVVATPSSNVPGTKMLGVGVTTVSNTGCKIWMTRADVVATTVFWVAVYTP